MTAKTFRALVILLPLLRHFERSEKSSYFSFRNTRLYWMFRGYASQHDAKRFGVRMTAKTFRALVILSAAKGPVISRFAIQDFTGFFRLRRQNDNTIEMNPLASPTCFCVFSSLWNRKATHTFSSAKETAPCT